MQACVASRSHWDLENDQFSSLPNVADRPVRRICLRAALLSTITNESIYFNHHESYYNKITIKRYFNDLGIYERYK